MSKIRGYQITVGLLIALLLVLNVIVPTVSKQKKEKQGAGVVSYFETIKNLSEADQASLLTTYLAENKQKPLATSANAEKLNVCDLNHLALDNVLLWWSRSPAGTPFPSDIIRTLGIILGNNGCVGYLE